MYKPVMEFSSVIQKLSELNQFSKEWFDKHENDDFFGIGKNLGNPYTEFQKIRSEIYYYKDYAVNLGSEAEVALKNIDLSSHLSKLEYVATTASYLIHTNFVYIRENAQPIAERLFNDLKDSLPSTEDISVKISSKWETITNKVQDNLPSQETLTSLYTTVATSALSNALNVVSTLSSVSGKISSGDHSLWETITNKVQETLPVIKENVGNTWASLNTNYVKPAFDAVSNNVNSYSISLDPKLVVDTLSDIGAKASSIFGELFVPTIKFPKSNTIQEIREKFEKDKRELEKEKREMEKREKEAIEQEKASLKTTNEEKPSVNTQQSASDEFYEGFSKKMQAYKESWDKIDNETYDNRINVFLGMNIERAIYHYHDIKNNHSNFDGHPSFSKLANVEDFFRKLIKSEGAYNKDAIIAQLTKYYETAPSEVKDLFEVASQIYWADQCGIHITPTNNGYGHPNSYGIYSSTKCTIKVVNPHGNVNHDFWASIVHELKHMLNSVIYQNHGVSYPNLATFPMFGEVNPNDDIYKVNVINPVLGAIKSNPNLNKGLYSFLSLYDPKEYDSELDVHCYQHLDTSTRGASPFSEQELRQACKLILVDEHQKFMDEACNTFGICEV